MEKYKDLMSEFEPLTHEEQENLFFVILDSLDETKAAYDKAETEEDKRDLIRNKEILEWMMSYFVKDHGTVLDLKRFNLQVAREARRKYMASIKKA